MGGTLSRIVVYVPARALEAESGGGQWTLQQALALGANQLGFRTEILDLLELVIALRAAIRI